MKSFLMLIRENMDFAAMTPEQMQAEIAIHMKWVEQLIEKGHFKGGDPLEQTGATLRGKDRVQTDGPYIELKECVSGYYFLLAESLEQAIDIAKGCPSLEYGGMVEVREIMVSPM